MGINQNRETYIQKCALYVFSLIVRKAIYVIYYGRGKEKQMVKGSS